MLRRIAIVGAGPSGFYAAEQLLKAGFAVDLLDRLPTPYGLVRAGVAPDHPKIKSVTRDLRQDRGELGLPLLRRRRARHARLARGAAGALPRACSTHSARPTDRRLGIPGEDLRGSHPATDFVGWYNGHPDYADHEFDLDQERAVVIGNGNVAVDVARMLVLATDELAVTDTADHALPAFAGSGVREVVLLGPPRPGAGRVHDAGAARARRAVARRRRRRPVRGRPAGGRRRRRSSATSRCCRSTPRASRPGARTASTCASCARRSRSSTTATAAWRAARRPQPHRGRPRASRPARKSSIECGIVLRAVGYRGAPVAGVPFDESRGRIHNDGGRVPATTARRCPASTRSAGSSAGRAASSGPTRSTRPDTVGRHRRGRRGRPARRARRRPGGDRGVARASACPTS